MEEEVRKEDLRIASIQHRNDVRTGMDHFAQRILRAGESHDSDKLTGLDHFHSDFKTGFKKTGWYDNHRKVNRHHIDKEDGRATDINLIDVLEHVADIVMAGMARSGSVYDVKIPDEVLQTALKNTVELLKSQVVVTDKDA